MLETTQADIVEFTSQARAEVHYWIERARSIYRMTPAQLPVPIVRFDLRGRMAGQAVLSRSRAQADVIRINTDLLRSHTRDVLEVTVPHEVAHVVVHYRHDWRVQPHGPEWKALMQAFGVVADVCHDLPVTPTRQLKRFRYICGCDEPAWLTSIRHRRAQNGTVYRCRRCRQVLMCVDAG